MRWTQVLALGAVASIAATAACGAPASKTAGSIGHEHPQAAEKASAGLMPDAKGPAPEVPGAKKGGTLTISYSTVPSGMDPSSQFYQDSAAILKLTNRALTTFALIDGKSVLVPDLATDLGKASADGMDWTYTLKDGLKYEDGTAGQGRGRRLRDQAVLRAGGAARRPHLPERLLQGRRHLQGPVQVR